MQAIRRLFSQHWALLSCLSVFLVWVAVFVNSVLQETNGVFIYPFDDVFIHMAIAKNFAFYGVWGISPHEFSSASSSVLYPLLLAGLFKLGGAHTFFPFLLNLGAGIAFVVVLYNWLRRQRVSGIAQLFILLATVVLTPLPAIALFGMEHTMHILFCFLFIYGFSEAVEREGDLPWQIYVYGVIAVATRYESVFLVMTVCGWLLVKRHFWQSIQLGMVSLLPIFLFGVISLYKGSYFIPNSVLIKSVTPPLTGEGLWQFFTAGIFNRLYFSHPSIGGIAIQRLLLALPLAWWAFQIPLRQAVAYRCILLLSIVACFMHLLFAQTGVLFRYEAYLIACAVPILGVLIARYSRDVLFNLPSAARWALLFLCLILLVPLGMRSSAALSIPRQGSINIYDMQYQMGLFVQRYYPTEPVAIGDIGAISWFSSANNVDLEGLGNIEVARSRKNHYWTPAFLDRLVRKDSVRIAIVFDRSYPIELRQKWTKVGVWQIPNNVACYSNVVSFYAVDSCAAPELRKHLKEFQKDIPKEVVGKIFPPSTAFTLQ